MPPLAGDMEDSSRIKTNSHGSAKPSDGKVAWASVPTFTWASVLSPDAR